MFIQGGVKNVSANRSGEVIKTKAELKRLVTADPDNVYFYTTSEMGNQFNGRLSELHSTMALTVVGPNPYNDRSWYATISKNAKTGKVTVK